MDAGLNLFSVRNYMDTEEHLLEAAAALKEMGYSYFQYSGGEFNVERIRRMIDETGIPVVLTHVAKDRILEDTEALMEDHEKIGCHNIGLGAMPPASILNKEECYGMVEKLEKAAEKMAANGFTFFYHNHNFEFYRHDGKMFYDYIIENAPHIHFTLDTYWAQCGGVDVVDLIRRLKGRIECIHLKDYSVTPRYDEENKRTRFEPFIAPVGDGNMDFPAIIRAAKESGTRHFLVEQDNAPTFPDPLGQVKRSICYLKNLSL